MGTPLPPRAQALFDWLVDGAPGATTPMAVVQRIANELQALEVHIERIAAFVRTLHPHVVGRRFLWEASTDKVEVGELSWDRLSSVGFQESPIAHVMNTGEIVRGQLRPDAKLAFKDLVEMRDKGFTELSVFPLKFMGGTTHAISFATRAPGGFADSQFEMIRELMRPLSRVAETLALMRTAVNLLNAYVGNDAGERILQGQIRRGDTQLINCVIWFSDLRGFTSLSSERAPQDIISVLNQFFECQVPAIEKEGGQVLKFIGDGLLAIFPVKADARASGDAAVRASRGAFEALQKLNATRAERGESALGFGVGLHLGEVAFGNIGGSNRLDFTAIGPAVNLASRIESMTGKLGKQVLVSGELAKHLSVATRSVGDFELKGVPGRVELFEL
ncbi:MAG: adenylate/guanylate cyclase domain-containing protein [Myxococcaceae bacterium]